MRMTVLFALFALTASAALAQPAAGQHPMARLRGYFTPEQMAVMMMQNRDKVQGMTSDQRRAFRQDQMARIAAMSEADRARMKADLQAQWDALPQPRKDMIEQRIAARAQPVKPLDLNPNQGAAVAQ